MTDGMGRPERRDAMQLYLSGLLLSGERKTAVSMGRRLAKQEDDFEGMRQRLQQCVAISNWSESEVFRRLAVRFEEVLSPEAFIVDDTGFPKKGPYSVGVQRQYSGTLGRTDNCQVATSLHVASDDGSGCIGFRLYLPEEWAEDSDRRKEAKIPDEIVFEKKWKIAIDLLDEALSWGLAPRIVLGDSGYGASTEFRDALEDRGCPYLVGIANNHMCWPPGSKPRLPKRKAGPGRPPRWYRDGNRKIRSVSEIGRGLKFRKFTVPDGKGGEKTGTFGFARVQLAERHTKGRPPSAEVWLICEYRKAKKEYRFHVSNLPANTPKKELVRLTKLRWRIERDYQEMKGEIGLDHYEGRTWRGFHHHAALSAAAHGFLALNRRVFSPKHQIYRDAILCTSSNSAIASRAHR